MSKHNVYTIQLASKVSGVGIHTIRAWEKRYQAVTPKRGDTGRREYSETEVERLRLLCELCTLGHTIGQIAKLETEVLKEMLHSLGRVSEKTSVDQKLSPTVDLDQSVAGLLLALEGYKLDIISHEFNKLALVAGPRDMVLKVMRSLFREVSRKVMQGELSLSQEHALMSLLRFHLGHTLYSYKDRRKHSGEMIVASPEGMLDELQSLAAALLSLHHHYGPIYLGPNLPCQALLEVLAAQSKSSVTLVLPAMADNATKGRYDKYIEKVLGSLGSEAMLFVNKCESFHPEKFTRAKKLVLFDGNLGLDEKLASLS